MMRARWREACRVNAIFERKAPVLMTYLMEAFGFTVEQAAGIAGNAGHESNGMTDLHELGQPANRGGYGWFQWTGPRRVDFMNWCKERDYDWTSDQADIGYLLHDLEGEYKGTVAAIHKAKTSRDACLAWERNYERAGVINMMSRYRWTDAALLAYKEYQKARTEVQS